MTGPARSTTTEVTDQEYAAVLHDLRQDEVRRRLIDISEALLVRPGTLDDAQQHYAGLERVSSAKRMGKLLRRRLTGSNSKLRVFCRLIG